MVHPIYRVWSFLSVGGVVGGAAVSTSHVLWTNSPSLRYFSTSHIPWGNLRSFPYVSLSHLLAMVMSFIPSTATMLITCTFILRGRTHSTLIPQQPSPYFPSSRRFRSPLYLRVEEVDGNRKERKH